MERNNMEKWGAVNGVDNILLEAIQEYKNKWNKIINL